MRSLARSFATLPLDGVGLALVNPRCVGVAVHPLGGGGLRPELPALRHVGAALLLPGRVAGSSLRSVRLRLGDT